MDGDDRNTVLHRLPESVINQLNEPEWIAKFISWKETLFPTFKSGENYFDLEKSESSGFGNTEMEEDLEFLELEEGNISKK